MLSLKHAGSIALDPDIVKFETSRVPEEMQKNECLEIYIFWLNRVP